MTKSRTYGFILGAAGAGILVVALRHLMTPRARETPGGIVMGDTAGYDSLSGLLLGSFYGSVATDVAAVAPAGGRVLDVGCGPGHLSNRLVRDHGLDVTGLDLDPAMIERARANAERIFADGEARPAFVVGDVGSLPFPDASFDLVVSTLSMHHWSDASAGQAEIARVLRPGGRALVWDIRGGVVPLHRQMPDSLDRVDSSKLHLVRAQAWSWPWRLKLTQRIELVAPNAPQGEPAARP